METQRFKSRVSFCLGFFDGVISTVETFLAGYFYCRISGLPEVGLFAAGGFCTTFYSDAYLGLIVSWL